MSLIIIIRYLFNIFKIKYIFPHHCDGMMVNDGSKYRLKL